MKYIKLTQGKRAIVDDEDFEYLNQFKWCYNSGYAGRTLRQDGKQSFVRMHRVINQCPPNLQTDHINGNTIDNRKKNLRNITARENTLNATKYCTNTSGYRGVHFDKKSKKWIAHTRFFGKDIYIGIFNNPREAYMEYCSVFKQLNGEESSYRL